MAKQTNKDKAIIALLTTNTAKEAAKEAGISVESVYRYLRDPEFVAEYRLHRRNLMEAALGRLQNAIDQAVFTLRKNLRCGNPSAENTAARIIIENAVKGEERTEILERLEALEANANS